MTRAKRQRSFVSPFLQSNNLSQSWPTTSGSISIGFSFSNLLVADTRYMSFKFQEYKGFYSNLTLRNKFMTHTEPPLFRYNWEAHYQIPMEVYRSIRINWGVAHIFTWPQQLMSESITLMGGQAFNWDESLFSLDWLQPQTASTILLVA
jgi:hypothetical protein